MKLLSRLAFIFVVVTLQCSKSWLAKLYHAYMHGHPTPADLANIQHALARKYAKANSTMCAICNALGCGLEINVAFSNKAISSRASATDCKPMQAWEASSVVGYFFVFFLRIIFSLIS